jgi:hypothetical protein
LFSFLSDVDFDFAIKQREVLALKRALFYLPTNKDILSTRQLPLKPSSPNEKAVFPLTAPPAWYSLQRVCSSRVAVAIK